MHRQIVIATIGDHIENGYTIRAHCNNVRCLHNALVDLEALAARLGRDFDTMRIRPRLRCTSCGTRDCSITVSPPYPDPGCFRPKM